MSGEVTHFEIPADDTDRAKEFYRSVFHWDISAVPGMEYSMITTVPTDASGMPRAAGGINGGMFRREGELAAPTVVVSVEDIDATLEQVRAHGGSTVMAKEAIMDMGWNAYFRDPEGNIVGLWQNAPGSDPGSGTGSGEAGAAANDVGA